MISRQDLKELSTRCAESRVPHLTVILNIDQTRASNLNRGFEAALKSLLQKTEQRISAEDRAAYERDGRRIIGHVADLQPEGKTVAVFSCSIERFFWHKNLSVGLESEAHWGVGPYLKPLLEVRGEAERCGVVLADRARGRLYTMFQGELKLEAELEAEADVKHFDASGADQMRSQMVFQRKAQEHVKWHLRRVVELLEKLADSRQLGSIVLGGPHEVLSELKGLLPVRLARALIGTTALPVESSGAEILAEAKALQKRAEDEENQQIVDGLLTAAAKNRQAVVGLPETLQALNQGRVRQLIYTDNYKAVGSECGECGALFSDPLETCPYCARPMRQDADLLEMMLERVFRQGGAYEQLRGSASDLLLEAGSGIGAYLRF